MNILNILITILLGFPVLAFGILLLAGHDSRPRGYVSGPSSDKLPEVPHGPAPGAPRNYGSRTEYDA